MGNVASIAFGDIGNGKTESGGAFLKSIENPPLDQIYPEVVGRVNLNTCVNLDCGNFGFAFNYDIPDPPGGS